jgi:FkbM family methyltransferase
MTKLLLTLFGHLPAWFTGWILKKRHDSRVLNLLSGRFANFLRNKEGTIKSGVGKGLFINVGNSAAAYVFGTFKSDLQSFLSSTVKQGNTFYDVGANVGFFSLLAARLVGPKGKVISFEPLPDNLVNLRENMKRNQFLNVQILPFALGANNEEQVFQVSERPTWGKLKSVGNDAPDKYLSDIKVAVRRLDDLLSDGAIPPPDFVKIDVEGAEVEVIEGAQKTLTRHRPTLIIELHGTGNLLTPKFAGIGYCAIPLNRKFDNVAEAHWNATILAIPAERFESVAAGRGLLHDLSFEH